MKNLELTDDEFTFLLGWLKKECRRTKQSVSYWSNKKNWYPNPSADVYSQGRKDQSEKYLEMVGPLYEKMKGI